MPIKNSLPALLACALLGLMTYLCWTALAGIYASWGQEEYSYAYFVLPIALWIGLHRLAAKPLCAKASWAGVGLVFFSLCFWMLGEVSGIVNLPQYGVLGLFYGLFLTYAGWSVTKAVAPALGYVFFAIPLPQLFYLSLSAKMQLISTDLGVALLQLVAIPVFQDGNVIDLGAYKLQVVEACGGLRYLFPLMSFGFLFALFLEGALWKRALVFLSAIPIAIAINALRIALIGTVASWGSTEAAVGLVHDIGGWVAFLVCMVLLYIETDILLRIPPRGCFAYHYFDLPKPPFLRERLRVGRPVVVAALLLLLVTAFHATGLLTPKPEVIPSREIFASFPAHIADWSGSGVALDKETLDVLKTTDVLSMTFGTGEENPVGLFVAYYDSQRNERTFHSPSLCLPGSGWENVSVDVRQTIVDAAPQTPLHYNRLLIKKGGVRQLVYYWYEQRGVSEPNFYAVKGRIIWDSMTKGRTDGALVRLITTIGAHESEAQAEDRLVRFLNASALTVTRYIPDYSLAQAKDTP